MSQLSYPMWVYVSVAQELVHLEDDSVWAIRNHIKNVENGNHEVAGDPRSLSPGFGQLRYTDFRDLHDLARYVIYVTESLDVSRETLEAILAQH